MDLQFSFLEFRKAEGSHFVLYNFMRWMSLQVFRLNTQLLKFPDTFLKISTLEWRKGLNMRPIRKQKLARFIVLYTPRALSFVVGRQGSRLSENGGDVSRGGFLCAWGCKNTVDCGWLCSEVFGLSSERTPPGEENKQCYKKKSSVTGACA
jgi:hypothetical protein